MKEAEKSLTMKNPKQINFSLRPSFEKMEISKIMDKVIFVYERSLLKVLDQVSFSNIKFSFNFFLFLLKVKKQRKRVQKMKLLVR